ncbi:MAG: DNA-binding domain-containing protein, partial [Burkholderiales bacterium]
MSTLIGTQSRFQAYVLAGDGAIVEEIAGADDASRRSRLDIYYNAYRLRLAEALTTDYEILKSYIGDEIFDAIVRDYIDARPSVFRNVRWFGGHLADFLRDQPRYAGQPIL